MNNSLFSLGERYAAEADQLEAMCETCRQRKKEALRKGDHETAARQELLIELHTQQRTDLLRLAAWLKNYYGQEKVVLDEMEKGGEPS